MLSRRVVALLLLLAPPVLADDLGKGMADVERLRKTAFVRDVAVKTVDRRDLREVLRREITKSLPYTAEDYVRVLKALQLIDADDPAVIDKMLDLYEAQVLAFYDPISHTYFAVTGLPSSLAGTAGAEALQQSVVVHELTHAIQDQRFDASKRDFALRHDVDGQLAYHALLEGEASLVMTAWLLDMAGQSIDDIVKSDMALNLMTSAAAADKTIEPGTPAYFVESLKFPYLEGLKLVVLAYRKGGWKEVDRLHANPPVSTREVLHPDEYFARVGRGEAGKRPFDLSTTAPDTITTEHLGEFHWRYLVGDRATGWVDDLVTVGCNGLVRARTQWENHDRATAFADAYATFLHRRGIEPRVTISGNSVDVLYWDGSREH